MQVRRQLDPAFLPAVQGQVGEIRAHAVQVQLAAIDRVGGNPAIGDYECLSVGHEPNLVGPNSGCWESPDSGIACRHIPYADAPFARLGDLFAGQEQRAAFCKNTVPVQVMPFGWRQPVQDGTGRAVDHQGEVAGAPGEGHGLGPHWMGGPGVAPRRQGNAKGRGALAGQAVKGKAPVRVLCRCQKGRAAHRRPAETRRCPAGQKRSEKGAAGCQDLNLRPAR